MGIIAMQGSGGLPAGYTKIEYIGGTGTEYIDTGIECTGDLVVEFKCRALSNENLALCGGIYTQNRPTYFRHHCSLFNTNLYWIQNSSSNVAAVMATVNQNIDYEIFIDPVNGRAKVNNSTYTFNSLTGQETTGKSYGICARISDTGDIQSRPNRIYYFRFYKNGNMIGNFIPCIRNIDSKPGMYDTVTRMFFTNAGTGEFNTPTT